MGFKIKSYPIFKLRVSTHPDSWEIVADLIRREWKLSKSSDGFFVFVYIKYSQSFFATKSLHEGLQVLEKYMGHRYMVDVGLMEKIKNEK